MTLLSITKRCKAIFCRFKQPFDPNGFSPTGNLFFLTKDIQDLKDVAVSWRGCADADVTSVRCTPTYEAPSRIEANFNFSG